MKRKQNNMLMEQLKGTGYGKLVESFLKEEAGIGNEIVQEILALLNETGDSDDGNGYSNIHDPASWNCEFDGEEGYLVLHDEGMWVAPENVWEAVNSVLFDKSIIGIDGDGGTTLLAHNPEVWENFMESENNAFNHHGLDQVCGPLPEPGLYAAEDLADRC